MTMINTKCFGMCNVTIRPANKAILNMALCEGRHQIPQATDGYVFGNVIKDVTDVKAMERRAFTNIWNAAHRHDINGEMGYLVPFPDWDEEDAMPLLLSSELHLNLYVTGLSVALVSVINVCLEEHVALTLWHYNRDSGDYYPQEISIERKEVV